MSKKTKWRLYIYGLILYTFFISFYKFDDGLYTKLGLAFLCLNIMFLYIRYEVNLRNEFKDTKNKTVK